jgi:hypothetical protein
MLSQPARFHLLALHGVVLAGELMFLARHVGGGKDTRQTEPCCMDNDMIYRVASRFRDIFRPNPTIRWCENPV